MSGSLSSLTAPEPSKPPYWLAPLAGGFPLAYYVAGASAYGGFYEEGAFIAAARSLGVPHPPGAPLTTLLSAAFALVPVGPLSFRVAVVSAVFAALTLALFARALYFTLIAVGVHSRVRATLASLAATWFVAQTPLFYAEATRPSVYAVQFALSLFIIDSLVRFELSEPTADRRMLYLAAFVQGLSFANHHVFALLMLAAAAPTLGRVFARRGFLGLMGHVAAPILGFSAWIYVPIRGGRLPTINIGEPSNLLRTFWVLNAEPFWGPPDAPNVSAFTRLVEGLGAGHDVVAFVLLAAALAGFVLAAGSASPRRFALLWLITLLVPFTSIALILQPKLPSDAYGALVPCGLAVVALATLGIVLAVQRFAARLEQLAATGALAAAVAAFALLALTARSRGLAHVDAPDAIDDVTRRELPLHSVLLTRDLGTWFRHLGAEAEEHLRPDVLAVSLSTLHYPRALEAAVSARPELAPLLGELTRTGVLAPRALGELSLRAPVVIELDRKLAPGLYPQLESEGLLERVYAGPRALDPRVRMHESARMVHLYDRLGRQARRGDLARRLSHTQYLKAVVAATTTQRDRALVHVALGLRSLPNDPALVELRGALRAARAFAPAAWLARGEEP